MSVIIALVIVAILIYIVIYIVISRSESLVSYGRNVGSLYTPHPYNPRPRWIATDHRYGWICDLGGKCILVPGGLLSQEECKKNCIVDKTDWVPPWTLIA